jgi:hypothetical protein
VTGIRSKVIALHNWLTSIAMNKPYGAKPLADLIGGCVADAFRRQGFTSAEIVTHWNEIVGAQLAEIAEPIRMKWSPARNGDQTVSATLVLRVEGPEAIEVQHLAATIIERVNGHVGWQAVGAIALRQAPLRRRARKPQRAAIDQILAASIAGETGIADDRLREAMGRLGAAIKQKKGA